MGRHIIKHDAIGADCSAGAYRNAANQNGAGIYDRIVHDFRTARLPCVSPSQRHILVDQNVISDFSLRADHYTHRMRKMKIPANPCIW